MRRWAALAPDADFGTRTPWLLLWRSSATWSRPRGRSAQRRNEDISIRHGSGQVIEIQAKSRRSQKVDLTAADMMRTLAAVWARQVDRLATEDIHVCLVVDRVPTGCQPTGLGSSLEDVPTLEAPALAAVAAEAGRSAQDLRARSHLLVGVAPHAFATGLLARHLDVLPIEAEVLFRQVLARIGVLVDRRPVRGRARRLSRLR